jgi:hypothetical protein
MLTRALNPHRDPIVLLEYRATRGSYHEREEMSARNPYANGYGYADRYDAGNTNLNGSVDEYGDAGIAADDNLQNGSREERTRERRQARWGGFYDIDESSKSREREQEPSINRRDPSRDRSRGRTRPNREEQPESTSLRSRPRDVNTTGRWGPGRDDADYVQQRNRIGGGSQRIVPSGRRGPQTVEGMID